MKAYKIAYNQMYMIEKCKVVVDRIISKVV